MARYIGVVRQSRTEEEAVSRDQQRAAITGWADIHGHEIIAWAEDLSTSGQKDPFKRPGLGPWLHQDRLDEYDGFVAFKIDRYSRRLLHFATLLDWTGKRGKALAAIADPLDTSNHIGRAIAQIVVIMAEIELENIRIRNRATHTYMRTVARFTGGTPAYGYRTLPNPDGPGSVLGIDPATAPVVYEMIDWILAGKSMNSLRDHLNTRAIASPRGKKWTVPALKWILSSVALLGQVEHKGRIVRDDDGMPLQRAEPLIDPDQFRRLQSALHDAAQPKINRHPKALLADVIYCAACGAKMYYRVTYRSGYAPYRYYQCGGLNHDRRCPDSRNVQAHLLDEAITRAILDAIGERERTERIWVPAEDHTAEVEQVQRAIEGVREERDIGLYDEDEAGYHARLRRLRQRLESFKALPSRPGHYEYVGTGETYRAAWARLDAPLRRKLLLDAGLTAVVGDPLKGEAAIIPAHTPLKITSTGGKNSQWIVVTLPRDMMERLGLA